MRSGLPPEQRADAPAAVHPEPNAPRHQEESGLLRRDSDLAWTRRAYLALMHEAAAETVPIDASVSRRAGLVLETLLRGVGTQDLDLANLLGT